MLRVRSLLLKSALAASVVAGLAACDAPSGALAPRQLRATPSMTAGDTTSGRSVTSSSVTITGDGEFCRSGYQVAYREDGTPYCAPIE